MATELWPDLSADYYAFRRILHNHIPDTVDKWRHERAKYAAELMGQGKHSLVDVKIDPDEFTRYCHTRQTRPDCHMLFLFTAEKRPRENH